MGSLGNILEKERLRKTRTIDPVHKGKRKALCPVKDQKQHPTKGARVEDEGGFGKEDVVPPSSSNVPCHVVMCSEQMKYIELTI